MNAYICKFNHFYIACKNRFRYEPVFCFFIYILLYFIRRGEKMIPLNIYLQNGTTSVSNLLFRYYKKIGMTDTELVFYLQLLQYQDSGDYFPDMDMITKRMDMSLDGGYHIIQELMTKGILSIETKRNKFGKTEDKYDLTRVYQKIELVLEQEQEIKMEQLEENKRVELFNKFEQEFGRSLSPIEFETVQQWLDNDNYSIDLIELALREAILNQAYSLKYMDRILLNWERKNLTSKQAIQSDQKQRLKEIDDKNIIDTEETLPKVPMYNWLNPGDK
ncbi:DnaD domain protein [Vagococcus sp. AM17-17]|nr:DnaD domain protein [Vagococcus sp. AM17-17]